MLAKAFVESRPRREVDPSAKEVRFAGQLGDAGTRQGSVKNSQRHEVWFQSLFNAGRALAFPCDDQGQVNLDLIGEKARNNYLFARAMVGRDYGTPQVRSLVQD